MNAERELNEAYAEWRRLAETEGQAIGNCNWSIVFACQKALQLLQARISDLTPRAKKEWARPGCDRAGRERALNATVRELITIQKRNCILLGSLKEVARTRLAELGLASQHLKQLNHSYNLDRSSNWSSFS
jgi:hypothetical protein